MDVKQRQPAQSKEMMAIKNTWVEAARLAVTIKNGFYTVLSSRDCVDEIRSMLENDSVLMGCFIP